MTFQELFPGISGWVDGLHELSKLPLPFGGTLQDIFAVFGALHLVGLAMLGGCSLLLSVRFMGAGLVAASPQRIERTLRLWFIAGVALALFTGIVMGALNAGRLYASASFFSKMLALAAALVFSFGVVNSIARADGAISRNTLIATVVAMVLWLGSLFVLVETPVTNVGLFHLTTASYAILLIFGSNRTRIIAGATYLVLFGGVFLMYWIVGFAVGYEPSEQIYIDISMYAVIAGLLVVIALLVWELRQGRADAASPQARMIALFSVLAWVTVAVGGRWIGLSP
jgi:hypothetical protein